MESRIDPHDRVAFAGQRVSELVRQAFRTREARWEASVAVEILEILAEETIAMVVRPVLRVPTISTRRIRSLRDSSNFQDETSSV
jgi:hypothetical protein